MALLPRMTTIVKKRARMKKLGCFLTVQRTTTKRQLAASRNAQLDRHLAKVECTKCARTALRESMLIMRPTNASPHARLGMLGTQLVETASSATVPHHMLIMWPTNASPHARLGMLATMTRTASSARVTHHTLIMWHTYASPNAQLVQLDMLIPTNVSRARRTRLPIMTPKNALLQEINVQ